MLALVIAMVITAGASHANESQVTALRYLETDYPFDSDQARRNLASIGNLHRIGDWSFVSKLRKYDLYYFRYTWTMSPDLYEVLAADAGHQVLRLKERMNFNILLSEEALIPQTADEAREVALFYLQVINVSSIVNYGLKQGVMILQDINDIPFKSADERKALTEKVSISPPSIKKVEPGRFRYTAYTWQREGSGAIDVKTIILGPKGLERLETKVLVWGVGMYEGIE